MHGNFSNIAIYTFKIAIVCKLKGSKMCEDDFFIHTLRHKKMFEDDSNQFLRPIDLSFHQILLLLHSAVVFNTCDSVCISLL